MTTRVGTGPVRVAAKFMQECKNPYNMHSLQQELNALTKSDIEVPYETKHEFTALLVPLAARMLENFIRVNLELGEASRGGDDFRPINGDPSDFGETKLLFSKKCLPGQA